MSDHLTLWFFRDLSDDQRLKLFGLFGLPTDEIGNHHGRQTMALRHIMQSMIRVIAKESAPEASQHVAGIENALADLIVAYYEREIGRLMQQAEHWAANGAPVAVMHRLHTADAYFQIVCQFRRGLKNFEIRPFDEIRRALARPKLMPLGTYPPSPELHRYRDPEFVAAALAFMEGSTDG